MSLCQSIDTLAMAYLDDELVAEERRELELHVLGCAACREHVETERAELELVRKALAPPPTPDVVKARIARALDDADREAARAERRRSLSLVNRWFLPGSAAVAAVAAVVVSIVAVRVPDEQPSQSGTVAKEVVRQQSRRTMPLEVQGAATRPWLRENFAPIDPPQFAAGRHEVELLGARLTAVNGHNAAQLQYVVTAGDNRFSLVAVVIDDLGENDLQGGIAFRIGDRTLHVHDANGMAAVSYVDEHHMGYVFASERLTRQELIELVVSSDLIGRAQRGR